ncbi:NAD(P)-binding protein [Hyaloscypha variabilis]
MSDVKRTVLVTGCSDGGLGAALAIAFHEAGLHVYATARNPSKMKQMASVGIETLTLDVLSDSSIAACLSKVSRLDILVNNAGGTYGTPVSDLSIPEAKKLFDLNLWAYIAVTQAFLPLLLKSEGLIVNHTSAASVVAIPFQSVYNASKAAMSMFSDTERLELEPFGVRVVDLKSGYVKSNLNFHNEGFQGLPKRSIYQPAKETVEKSMRGDGLVELGIPAHEWAKQVVQDLLKKKPPANIWRGASAFLVWIGTFLPHGMLDTTVKKASGFDIVEQKVRKQG